MEKPEILKDIDRRNINKCLDVYQKVADQDGENPENSITHLLYNRLNKASGISIADFVSMLYGGRTKQEPPTWAEMDEEYRKQLLGGKWLKKDSAIIHTDNEMERQVSAGANVLFILFARLKGIDKMTPPLEDEELAILTHIGDAIHVRDAVKELVDNGYIKQAGNCYGILTETGNTKDDIERPYFILIGDETAELELAPDVFLVLKAMMKLMDPETNIYDPESGAVEELIGITSAEFEKTANFLLFRNYIAYDGNSYMINPNIAFGSNAPLYALRKKYWETNEMDSLL